jgi:hypothetical protein
MSIEAVALVLNHSKATGRTKLVLIGIANHLGDQGAYPAIRTLARYANASERSVKRDIQELIKLGELRVELQNAPTNRQYKTNLYWITIQPGVTDSASGVTAQVSRGDSSGKSGVTPVGTQNIILTIKEPSMKQAENDFDKFWEFYPKKRARADAEKAWTKAIKRKPASEIIELAKAYSQGKLPAEEYIPNGSTWLNNNRWEDVDATTQKPSEFKTGVFY